MTFRFVTSLWLAAGGDRSYAPVLPATALKVAGIDLTSIGHFEAGHGQEAIVLDDPVTATDRKLVIADGRVVGAILLGAGNIATAAVRSAIARRRTSGATWKIYVLTGGKP